MLPHDDYQTCPTCKGADFKEYALDLVVSTGVSISRDGEANYRDAEVDGFLTTADLVPGKKVFFYTCMNCGEILVYRNRTFIPPLMALKKEDFLRIVEAVG